MKERTKQRIANVVAMGLMLLAATAILAGLVGFYMLADLLGGLLGGLSY